MQTYNIFFLAPVILIFSQSAASTKQSQEILLERILNRLNNLKYTVDEINTRIKLLEVKTEELLKPAAKNDDEPSSVVCDCDNKKLIETLVEKTKLIRNNQNNLSSILASLEGTLQDTFNVNKITSSELNSIQHEAMNGGKNYEAILNEVLKKQTSLQTTFQLILDSSEKNSTAQLIKKQFDDLRNFIKAGDDVENVEKQESPLHDKHLNCLKNCDDSSKIFENCESALKSNDESEGVYLLKIPNVDLEPFYGYCKSPNWLIIQRREDGSQDFYRNWNDYKRGFGKVFDEYWIGLDRLYAMTNRQTHELYISMEDYAQNKIYAKYLRFRIGSEEEGYPLNIDAYSGNSADALEYHNNTKFSTFDRDNDEAIGNCARLLKGGWWYKNCYASNLNGRYLSFSDRAAPYGIKWTKNGTSKRSTYMAIRPRQSE